MRIEDYLEFAKSSLLHRRLRSWLTILGIIIGIAAVFSLISIGQGFEQSIKDQLAAFGGNFLFIVPSTQSSGGPSFGFSAGAGGPAASIGELTTNDIAAIKGVKGIEFVDGFVFDVADVEFRGETITATVNGMTVDIIREFPLIEVETGRVFSSAESKSAILGKNLAEDLFDREIKLGDIISIDGENFRVIGIWEQGSGATSGIFDDSITIQARDAKRLFQEPGSNEVSAIIAKGSENADAEKLTRDVEKRLRASHKLVEGDEDFTVISSQAIQSSVSQITGGITLFLGGIAAIALLVGAIGIINTMFMSVMERTKQIGILKALGARSTQILTIFLVESSLLGFVGGVIGVSIGLAFGLIIGSSDATAAFGGSGFKPAITAELIVFSVGFSVIVGGLSGYLPARRAAHMDPVESLRYE